jgi:hypothetical protein
LFFGLWNSERRLRKENLMIEWRLLNLGRVGRGFVRLRRGGIKGGVGLVAGVERRIGVRSLG